eukprot:CAMPEP_0177746588 /NCGR_PEP_ID=MMETSP0484_2-20121128/30942_1 /TAXON_ID=354590 /ORGANISM="Rhodomonas lens, Strain RHODO" /LENGTH=37 /DNA_ID= /DNA_START= /DNA_END= /DNA_ORIENTATION=
MSTPFPLLAASASSFVASRNADSEYHHRMLSADPSSH